MMRRLIFLSPLIIATILCVSLVKTYIDNNSRRAPDTAKSALKIAMEKTGYFDYESFNRRSMQKFSLTVRQGVTQIREQMDFVSSQRQRLMDQVQRQQQAMEDQRRSAAAIKAMIAQNNALGVNVDMLRIQDLMDALDRQTEILEKSQQRLLNANRLIDENNTKMRRDMVFADATDSNTQAMINDRMEMLRNQSAQAMQTQAKFMEDAQQYVDLAHEQTRGIAQQLIDTNNYLNQARGPSNSELKDHVNQLLDKERELMSNIDYVRERIEQQRQELKRREEEYQAKMNDLLQSNSIKVQEARQKADDLNRMNKEKIADQMMRLREQRMDRQK